jgi:dipeptidyl aminopeptidase/acylaminoacyl peptidase
MRDFSVERIGVMPVIARRHKIGGTVTVDGSPAKRLVIAVLRANFQYVGATYSDQATGAWEIKGLPEYPDRSIIVLALDSAGLYNAEVADYITQVATVAQ